MTAMTRAEIVASRISTRSATYTPPGEDTGSSKWLVSGALIVIGAMLFWVGRPACRDSRVRAGGDCW